MRRIIILLFPPSCFGRRIGAPLAAVLRQPALPCRAGARGDIDRVPGLGGLLGVDDALLDLAREGVEGLFDVDVALGRDLHERDAELVGQRLALFGRHRPLLLPVALVADQDLVHALGGVLLDVGEPGSDVWRGEEVSGGLLVRVIVPECRRGESVDGMYVLLKLFSSVTS